MHIASGPFSHTVVEPSHSRAQNGRVQKKPRIVFVQIGAMLDGSADMAKSLKSLRPDAELRMVDQRDTLAYIETLGAGLSDQYTDIEHMRQADGEGEIESIKARMLAETHAGAEVIAFPGQEAWVPLAFRLSNSVAQAKGGTKVFEPPDKIGLRKMLDALQSDHPHIHAVRWKQVDLRGDDDAQMREAKIADAERHVGYPAVFKPSNGGGGLGVAVVRNRRELRAAAHDVAEKHNYGGGALTGFLLEPLFEGPENSIQATVHDGTVHIASETTKIVAKLEDGTFAEAGHIVQPAGALGTDIFRRILQTVVEYAGYERGPLQADFVKDNSGNVHLIDLGFRISGMGVAHCTNSVNVESWPDAAARALLREPQPKANASSAPAAVAKGTLALHNRRQIRAAKQEVSRLPRGFNATVTQAPQRSRIDVRNSPVALQAFYERFGDIVGRFTIAASSDVRKPEPAIRKTLEAVAKLHYRDFKPAEKHAANA